MRYVLSLMAAVLCGAVVAAAAQKAFAARPEAPDMRIHIGRFQILNATPTYRSSTMLLDTSSGETWTACATTKEQAGPDSWCKMSLDSVQPAQGQTP